MTKKRTAVDVRSEIAQLKVLVPAWEKMESMQLVLKDMELLAARVETRETRDRETVEALALEESEKSRSRGGPMTPEARRAGLEVLRAVIRRHHPGFDVVFEAKSMVFALVYAENSDVVGTYDSQEEAERKLADFVESVADPSLPDEIGIRAYDHGRPVGDWQSASEILGDD